MQAAGAPAIAPRRLALGNVLIAAGTLVLSASGTLNARLGAQTAFAVTLLVGDQEFDSPKTLAAFALGLVLFCVTLTLNVVALTVVRRYREKYD